MPRAIPDLGVVDAALRPRTFIRSRPTVYARARLAKAVVVGDLGVFFLLNAFLFAIPVVGVTSGGFRSGLQLLTGMILIVAGTTYWLYHAVLVVTGNSDGLLRTLQTTVYTTSVYFTGFCGFAFSAQSRFTNLFAYVLELIAALARALVQRYGTGLPRSTEGYQGYPIPIEGLFSTGSGSSPFVFTLDSSVHPVVSFVYGVANVPRLFPLVPTTAAMLALGYYLYASYLGARVRHGAARSEALLVVAATAFAPLFALIVLVVHFAAPFVLGGVLIAYFLYQVALTRSEL